MFVISVMDNGNERNFVATDVCLVDGEAVIDTGGVEIRFPIAAILDILPVDGEGVGGAPSTHLRSYRIN